MSASTSNDGVRAPPPGTFSGSQDEPRTRDSEIVHVASDWSSTVKPKKSEVEDLRLEVPLSTKTVTMSNDIHIPWGEGELRQVSVDLTQGIRDIWSECLVEGGLDPGRHDFITVLHRPSASLLKGIKQVRNHYSASGDNLESINIRAGARVFLTQDLEQVPVFAWQISAPQPAQSSAKVLASSNKFTQKLTGFSADTDEDEEEASTQAETSDVEMIKDSSAEPEEFIDHEMNDADQPGCEFEKVAADERRQLTFYRAHTHANGYFEVAKNTHGQGRRAYKPFSVTLDTKIEGTASDLPGLAEKFWKQDVVYKNLHESNKGFWYNRDKSVAEDMLERVRAESLASLKSELDSLGADNADKHTLWTGFGSQSGSGMIMSTYCGWELETNGATSLDHPDIHHATCAPPQRAKYVSRNRIRDSQRKGNKGKSTKEGNSSNAQGVDPSDSDSDGIASDDALSDIDEGILDAMGKNL